MSALPLKVWVLKPPPVVPPVVLKPPPVAPPEAAPPPPQLNPPLVPPLPVAVVLNPRDVFVPAFTKGASQIMSGLHAGMNAHLGW